jgi:hypothetical protein
MAEKGWTAQLAAAAGVAAGTGAAQLGLGYGLGVIVWPALPTADDSIWLGSLGWATWIAASATVFGAVIAGRLGRPAGGPWRFALAASAAVGALLTVALIALPARAAVRADTFSPQTIAGGYAVIGVLLGLLIAYWAVVSRPVAANLIATAAWLWSLAVAATVASIFWHRPSATYLSSWQFASPNPLDGGYGTIYWPSAVLTLLAALVVGVIGALPAARRGDLGVGAAASGAVGPFLVAMAFFVLAPQLTEGSGPLQSAYLIAPYAVLAGLAGSAMTVALAQRRATRIASEHNGARHRSDTIKPQARELASESTTPGSTAAGPADSGRGTASGTDSDRGVASPTGSGRATARPARAEAPESSSRVAGRSRPSFLGRLRRSAAAQDNAEAAIATGRAKAPTSSAPASPAPNRSATPTPRTPSSSSATATATAAAAATESDLSASGRTATGTTPGQTPAGPTTGRTNPEITNPDTTKPRAAGPQAAGPQAATSGAAKSGSAKPETASGPTAASAAQRGQVPMSRPSSPSRSGVASVDGGARPARPSVPGQSSTRSTVAPPPTAPPIAKINEPRPGETAPPRANPGSNGPNPSSPGGPNPPDAAKSDKAPSVKKAPARPTTAPTSTTKAPPTKAAPTNPAPTNAAPTNAAPTNATPAKATKAANPPKPAPAKAAPAKATPTKAPSTPSEPKAAPTRTTPTKAPSTTPSESTPAPTPDAASTTGGPTAEPPPQTDDKGSPWANPLWVDDSDTAELPTQEPKKRGLRRLGRRPTDDQQP